DTRSVARWLRTALAAVVAVALLAVVTIGSLVGLNAECNGTADECPRSDAYIGLRLAMPPAVLLVLVIGTVWAIRRRTLRPLWLAEAVVLVLIVVLGAAG